VRYETAGGFRAAIDARLKNYVRDHGEAALARLRRHIAFDRFLARLVSIDPHSWTLKGGLALDYRLGERARATRDIDLLHDHDIDQIQRVFDAIQAADPEDFFDFSIKRTNKLDALVDGTAIRYHVTANLNGKRFESFSVDIGFDQTVGMRTEMVRRSGFLEFAGLGTIELPALAIEYHLAEKLHAYSKTYPENRLNTRVKDLVDMVLIGSSFDLRASDCIEAIQQTFAARATQDVPGALAPPPREWVVSYPAMATSVSLDPDIKAGHAFAAALFDPLLSGSAAPHHGWQAASMKWLPSAASAESSST
jgi:hypothetical protein